ncbi:MAG TPA: peptidoglycan-binding domain-containing protein [Pseudoxanthomonas sp.]|nr:peptidoglycan-binding domain-containing protein [Pseudoxanthomonas sp.]
MEVDTRYYQHYENYMGDLVSGRLSIDPERRTAGIEARPVLDDGVVRIGESAGIVRTVQQRLNEQGFRGADNRPLEVDGIYRLSMQAAVINFQQARGLPQTGDIDPVTLQEIAPRIFPPAVNDEHHRNGADPELPPYMNRHGAAEHDYPASRGIVDPLLPQAERAVRRLDQNLGHEYNDQSACMAASVACLAKTNGLSQIDHVLLSEARGTLRQGENLFVVQGDPGDPAHKRAQMKTEDAASTPVEQSTAQLQSLNEVQQRQQPAQAMEASIRETSPQMRMS